MADDAAADDSEAPAPAEEEETPAEEPATADEASPPEVEAESPAADAADGPDDASPVAEEDAGAEPEAEAAEDTPAAGESCHRFERHLSAVVLGAVRRLTWWQVSLSGFLTAVKDSACFACKLPHGMCWCPQSTLACMHGLQIETMLSSLSLNGRNLFNSAD